MNKTKIAFQREPKLMWVWTITLIAVVAGIAYLVTWVGKNYIIGLPVSEFDEAIKHAQAYQQLPDLETREAEQYRAGIVWRIYGLESSFGKADGCKRKGKFNGYGFRQNKSEFVCYDTFEEVTEQVHNWVQDKIDAGWSEGKIFCRYNTGLFIDDCPYYQNSLKIN